jgi:hypothetical protein
MAILSKQIGWSNESNLLWEILKKLSRLAGIIGGLKPKYKVYTAIYTQFNVTPGFAPDLVNVLENTITPNDTPVISYLGPGRFQITFSSAVLTTGKVFTICNMWGDDNGTPIPCSAVPADTFYITIGNPIGYDTSNYIAVEIRVY